MVFPYSKRDVSKAGKLVASLHEEATDVYEVIEAWRAAHDEPLNKMLDILNSISKKYSESFVVGRLKRTDTIIDKLKRPGFNYDLSTLDDIAGCRIVLSSLNEIAPVVAELQSSSGYKKTKNYIEEPKKDGYRSVHTFHRFDVESLNLDNLRVEVQVRTRLQHGWATAVESYDLLSRAALKFGRGNEDEARFFLLASKLIALHEDKSLDNEVTTPRLNSIVAEILEIESSKHILQKLRGFSESVYVINPDKLTDEAQVFLITFNYSSQYISILGFQPGEETKATDLYSMAEQNARPEEVILLVQGSSFEVIQEAYPNYFSDISFFLDQMDELISLGLE